MTGVWQMPGTAKTPLEFLGVMTEKAIFAVLSALSCNKSSGGFVF